MKPAHKTVAWVGGFLLVCVSAVWGQDLGPGFTKVKEGIYVYAAKEGNSTCSIVLTDEGVVLIV